MNVVIRRVSVHAKPAATHKEFKQFETANIVFFAWASSEEEALLQVRAYLKLHQWELLQIELSNILTIPPRRAASPEMNAFIDEAMSNGFAARVFPKNFAPGREGIPVIRPPRVNESFIDRVVLDVHGERLQTDNENRIVDYRIGNWLFDLKDLQEEGLLKPERQEKLANLFAPYLTPPLPFQIDPQVLNESERRKYFDIISGPIQTQVKSTAKQIKSTRDLLAAPNLKGGIIFLNTGYGSFPPDEFGPLVDRFVKKDTKQIEAVLCISTWAVTNGFSSKIFFKAYPENPDIPEVATLQQAFGNRFEEAMTQLMLDEIPKASERLDPLAPVCFSIKGLDFSWLPPEIPSNWKNL